MAVINSMVFSTSWLIVLEKLRIIWSGQQIVVSRLLKSRGPLSSESSVAVGLSRLSSGILSGHDSMFHTVSEIVPNGPTKIEQPSEVIEPHDVPEQGIPLGNTGDIENHDEDQAEFQERQKDGTHTEQVPLSITVNMRKPLPSQLEKSILYMKEMLTSICGYSMTGLQVPKQELEKLRDKGKRFGDMCGRIVIAPEEGRKDD